MDSAADTWAIETFGSAELGDERRKRRLIRVAASAAVRPGGTVTGVLPTSAEREGAFRLLENEAVCAEAVAEAAFAATARKCTGDIVIVPVDQSSLTLTDRARRRELGRNGSSHRESRGLQVMTALAVDVDGTPVGVLDQAWWARTGPRRTKKVTRGFGDAYLTRETRFWVDALRDSKTRLESCGGARPWFQMDRGADAWPVFMTALEEGALLTIRSRADRRVILPSGQPSRLTRVMRVAPKLGTFSLNVPARPKRPARTAALVIRAQHVTLSLRIRKDKRVALALNAVRVSEVSDRADRIEWLLLTTHPASTFEEARAVVRAYAARWRIEEFHRTWKSGLCDVERTQLHTMSAIVKWATLLAAVAARALRLAYLARNEPNTPASTELSDDEVAATYILYDKQPPRAPTIADVVLLIAKRGGYTGNPRRAPPGPKVIGRGLLEVEILARALPRLRQKCDEG